MNLIGKGADPKFWSETVRNGECHRKFVNAMLADWERLCENQPIYELKYSAFKQFFVTGNRGIYEGPYFKRRGKLAVSAILALIYPEEEKYLEYLQNTIFAICDEYTWCLPAHLPKLEENDNSFIDLFAAETGYALAEIYTLLGDRLEGLIKDRIRVEINRRIIDSYMSDRKFWWTTCTNNWAAVCCGSVACTFMLMRPDLFDTVKPRFDATMECFLSGFNDDGYCLEGTGYWHYGFGFFVTYADMLKTYTEGKEDYFTLPKIRTISTFIQKMFLSGTCAVSFADGDTPLTYHLGMLHYLKNLYPEDVKVYSPEYAFFNSNCYRFGLLWRCASWLDEDIYNNPEPDFSSAEYYADASQWYVKKTENYGFAAKGGHNKEHHNHNDVGTFIFAKNGNQIITDTGRGVYTKQYFRNETRYEMIECSSLGHAVPYFGEKGAQGFGSEYAASNSSFTPGCFSVDIAGAYPDENVNSIYRTFKATDDSITLTDCFEYSGNESITEIFPTLFKPEIGDGVVTIGDGALYYDAALYTPTISSTVTSKKHELYFVEFKLDSGCKKFEMTLK